MLIHPKRAAVLRGPVAAGSFGRAGAELTPGPCIARTGNFTAKLLAGTAIEVAGQLVRFDQDKAIGMPGAPVAGTDYAVWVSQAGDVVASSNFSAAPGGGNWRRVGGFHYAPGGNAPAAAGGDDTPQINPYSIWDVAWRPACRDPRGMTLVAGGFWSDIYLCGVDHHVNGTSVHGVTIADHGNPPKVPAMFGGNGTTTYGNGNWWSFAELLASHGKRLPTYGEFAALAYGTTEGMANGVDPVTTQLIKKFTSKWGVMQASGCMLVWGDEFSYRSDGGTDGWAFRASTLGRGSLYLYNATGLVAAVFGGNWIVGALAGSRCSYWSFVPWGTDTSIGARGVCDHLDLA